MSCFGWLVNVRVLLGGTAKNTGGLLRMLFGVFCLRELSGIADSFCRVYFFWSGQSVFSWRVKNATVLSERGARK